MTQSALASRADLDSSYVSFLEMGQRNPTFGTLLAISQSLDIPLPELLQIAALKRGWPRISRARI